MRLQRSIRITQKPWFWYKLYTYYVDLDFLSSKPTVKDVKVSHKMSELLNGYIPTRPINLRTSTVCNGSSQVWLAANKKTKCW